MLFSRVPSRGEPGATGYLASAMPALPEAGSPDRQQPGGNTVWCKTEREGKGERGRREVTTRSSSDTGSALLLALLQLPASRLPPHIPQRLVRNLLPVRSDPGAVAEPFPGQSICLKQASAWHRRHNRNFAALFHFSCCLSDACRHQPPTQGIVIYYGDGWPVIHWPPRPSRGTLFWQWLYR